MRKKKKKKSPKNVNLEEYINFSFFMLSYLFVVVVFPCFNEWIFFFILFF